MNRSKFDLDSPNRIVTIREILDIAEFYGYDTALAAALAADTVVIQ